MQYELLNTAQNGSPMKNSRRDGSDEAHPRKDFEDVGKAEYLTADNGLEDVKPKPIRPAKINGPQCSQEQPAQESVAKAAQFTRFKSLALETQDAILGIRYRSS